MKSDLIAVLLGAVSAAALPPVHAIPVLLVTIPGLLRLIGRGAGIRAAARRGLWFGFGLNLVGLYWITEAILFEADRFWWLVPLAVPAVSVVMGLFIAFACAVARAAPPGFPRVAALAGAWVLGDLARQFVASGFPWNPLGSVWEMPGAPGDMFIQPAAWVSVHGLTLATILLAGTPVGGMRAWLGGVVGLAAWAGLGLWRLGGAEPPAPGVAVVLVQGNIAEGQKWSRETAIAIFRHHLDLTRQGVAEAAARDPGLQPVVVWPETASPFLLDSDLAARQAIAEAASGPARGLAGGGTPALIGSVRFDDGPRNALFALTGDGAIAGVYDKWHLVPFGEYQPAWLPGIQVVPGGGFHAGTGPGRLELPGIPSVAPVICYEAIFPGEVVDEAARPEWIVNVTNDAWFGNSTGPRQHLAAARMRAVEEGLPLLRAANTGISAAFDARGHEIGRLGLDQSGVLVVSLPGSLPQTFFARYGLWVPALLAACMVAISVPRMFSDRRFRYNKMQI